MYALEAERLHATAFQMEPFANYDMLTGLPNRRYFFSQLQQLVTSSDGASIKSAIFSIDLDAFKSINDSDGHEVGDEFAIIIKDLENVAVISQSANRILQLLHEPISMNAIECNANASIGIAIFPDAGTTSESLLKNADSAMYEAKRH